MPEGATRPSVPNKGKEPHAPCPCPGPRHPAGRPGVRGLIFKYLAYLKGKSTGIISMWLHLEIDTDKQIQIHRGYFFFFLIHLKLRLGKLPIWFLRESRKGARVTAKEL